MGEPIWAEWVDRFNYWLDYQFFRLAALACWRLGHDWCEWDTLPEGPGGRPLEYRVCNRCAELDERAGGRVQGRE